MRESEYLLEERFGRGEAAVVSRAPGRVNLIGEHTDYTGGYVLPFTIDRFTDVALRPRADGKIRVFAEAFEDVWKSDLPVGNISPSGGWEDYLKGILLELSRYVEIRFGFDGAISGGVPLGAGLSSSASLQIALAIGLLRIYETQLDDLELIKLCLRAENEFVGTACGIMDQYASLLGQEGMALFLDTRALTHRYVPLALEETDFLVIDSGVRHSHTHSGYNERQRECQEATTRIAHLLPDRAISSLRDVTREDIAAVAGGVPAVLHKRATHVVLENARVLKAVSALERGNAEELGALLFESHQSLRELFQVSTPELDVLVDWGRDRGALGARLIGGGFGGTTLHLVPAEIRAEYVQGIVEDYERAFGRRATVLDVLPSPGAKQLQKE